MRQTVVDYNEPSVMNLCINPSLEVSTSGVNPNGSAATTSRPTTGGRFGSAYLRMTITTAGSYGNLGAYQRVQGPVSGGKTYTASIYARTNRADKTFRINMECYNSTGSQIVSYGSGDVASPANLWTHYSLTASVPANTTAITMTAYTSGTSGPFVVGDTLDFDGFMVTEGSVLWPYRDGSYPGWQWNGTPHGSTSAGFAIPDLRYCAPRKGAWYSDAACSYSVLPEVGPTGLPVERATRLNYPDLGWGCYFGGTIPPGVLVPAGTPLTASCWARGSQSFNALFQIINDQATSSPWQGSNIAVSTDWKFFSFNSVTAIDLDPTVHNVRAPMPDLIGATFDISDVRVRFG